MQKKVLLIEDDKAVRENTAEILELANYRVKTAANGKLGVALSKSFLPDIIICDILMPILDGYGVLQIVSKIPELEQVPFIFLTAKTHHDARRKGMEMGADDYISKPFEESELLRAVESRIRRVEVFEHKQPVSSALLKESYGIQNIKKFDQYLSQKKVYSYKPEETIYCEENQSNHIFLIKRGTVKVYRTNELGKELILSYYADNQYFGHTSFVKNVAHTDNSKAVTETQLYKISKNEITSIISNNHHVIYNFIDLLTETIADLKERILLFAYASVRQKTAVILLYLLKKYPNCLGNEIKINRSNLAHSIGIAKETLIRTLHDFKEEELIALTSKSIKILDKKGLEKVR